MNIYHFEHGYGSTYTIMAESEEKAKTCIVKFLNDQTKRAKKEYKLDPKSEHKKDRYEIEIEFNQQQIEWVMKTKAQIFGAYDILVGEIS